MMTERANQETQIRKRIVEAAHGWLGTAYHTGGRVKGAGVDCLTLLAEVYCEAGVVEKIEVPYYPHDWHLHRSEERYLHGLLRYTKEVTSPLPGDIALWKFGRCFSHGAIVTQWPRIIHAYLGRECTLENGDNAYWLKYTGESVERKLREVRFFSAL